MIRIVTDSAADFDKNELEKYEIKCVHLCVNFGEQSYIDGINLEKDKFYDLLQYSDEFPKTSQPSPESFLKVFEEAKESGDTVLAILLSGALSGTIQSAKIAKDICGYDDIHIIDSKTVSAGEKLLTLFAVSLRDKGYSAEAIINEVEKLRGRCKVYAGVDTLEYLYKGGRLSKTAAEIGTLVNIKPIVKVTPEGEVSVADKCMGRKSMLSKLIKYPEKTGIDSRFPICFLYSQDKANCNEVMDKMDKLGYDMNNSMCINICPTVGAHVGIGAVGIAYVVPEEN